MSRRTRLSAALLLLAGALPAVEPYIKPGDRYAEIRTAHLRAFVPRAQVDAMQPVLQRAEVILVAMAAAAQVSLSEPLDLLLSDEFDQHNGFSTVIPRPLVQVLLAPAPPTSLIFSGEGHLERTLIHEFAHHLSNDRNHGFRAALERIFGRVLPFDPASLLLFYLSAPAHVTSPGFWHEGVAQWAETVYAPADSVWGGRGRDPLVHAIWRLDAAAGRIPAVGDWKAGRPQFPFGSTIYVYGLAYFRWLEGTRSQRAGIWSLVDAQARQWAFAFDDGSVEPLGSDHTHLLTQARNDLLQEQRATLAVIREKPVTVTPRLTATDTFVGAPAWTSQGRLLAAQRDPWNRPRLVVVSATGTTDRTDWNAFSQGEIRRFGPASFVRAETPSTFYAWARSQVEIIIDGRLTVVPGERLLQPDARHDGNDLHLVAIRLEPGGQQSFVQTKTRLQQGVFGGEVHESRWDVRPTQGRAWSPTFAPDGQSLAWVETDAQGSRLLRAGIAVNQAGQEWLRIPGRILHPVWAADGSGMYFCADHSGVANAYFLASDSTTPQAVTNTIGAITACVPSPDGSQLALIAQDSHGPFLSIIANDSAQWPGTIPQITPTWPTPAAQPYTPPPALPSDKASDDSAPDAAAVAYHGLVRIRPQFWTPTTLAAPDGGFGLFAFAADPLFTHQLALSAGIGPAGYEPVGQAVWSYSGWPVEIGARAWRSERSYNNLLLDTAAESHDYVETLAAGEIFAGTGLFGSRRRLFGYAAAGIAAWRTSTRGAEEYADATIVTGGIFTGDEQYVAAVIGYGDTRLFPTSYASEQGVDTSLEIRRSGFGGDLDQTRIIGRGDVIWSVWPRGGHQLRLSGQVGRSFGDDETLQGSFSIGGILGLGLPRGYYDIEAVGTWLVGGSAAYRFPLWRPFHGFGSSPWTHRQVAMEIFYDAAEVSRDQLLGDGQLYASTGIEIHDEWDFYGFRLQPGVGVARQLDGDEDTTVYFTLSFR